MREVLRPESEVVQVRELLRAGLSDYEIARRTGIPRGTILGWRHGRSQSGSVALMDEFIGPKC
jgi:transcriptional regulator with XRE-family HTH domain